MNAGHPLLSLYAGGMRLMAPAAPLLLRRRVMRGKEDPVRLGERMGRASRPRPPGRLVWMHGASIGEATSLLALAEAIGRRGMAVLLTSGTRTAAEILARRLPPGGIHQYVPIDAPPFLARFLDHWRPGLAVFAESEIWPNTVAAVAARGIPLVLVNARLSARSAARWARLPGLSRALFGRVRLGLAQSEADADRLSAAGVREVLVTGNLKFDAPLLPADPARVERLTGRLAGRPVWMVASTHPGEEEIVMAAHRAVAASLPGLVTVLAPRHPERCREVADLAGSYGLSVTRESERATGGPCGDVHLIDAVGELGIPYRVAPLVFAGGSLVPHGGQNPIEPARLGAALLHGPHVANFRDVYAALDDAGGALKVEDGAALARSAAALLADPAGLRAMARQGAACTGRLTGALDRTLRALKPLLPAGAASP